MSAPADQGLAAGSFERRLRFLEEMGVGTVWLLRARPDAAPVLPVATDAAIGVMAHARADAAADAPSDTIADAVPAAGSAGVPAAAGAMEINAPSAASHLSSGPDADSDVPAWAAAPAEAFAPVDAPVQAPAGAQGAQPDAARADARAAEIAALDWPALQAHAARCTACALCRTRSQVVFGDGDEQAQWLFVSVAPDRADDAAGTPLAGARGQLMDNMLRAAGRNRIAGTYLTPAVKCLPLDAAGNPRAPDETELAACSPYLERQIALLAPQVIVAMGAPAAPLAPGQPRGRAGSFGGAALITMADPQQLLDDAGAKAHAWADLCLAGSRAR